MPPALHRPLLAAALAVTAIARAGCLVAKALPDIPDPHGFAGAFAGVSRDHLLAGGGANFPDGKMPWAGGKKVWHDRLFALDLTKEGAAWREIGRLPRANGYGVSLTTGKGVLIFGGGDAIRHFAECLRLSLDQAGQPHFEQLPPLPAPRAQMCGALVGRRVHLCGGIPQPDSTRATADHWCLDFDQPNRGWHVLPPLPAPGRILATGAAIDGAFLVLGGCALAPDANGKPARTYLLDAWRFADGKWSALPGLPRASVAAASPAPVIDSSVFLVSGDDGTQAGLASPADHKGFTPQILRLDCRSNKWEEAGSLDVPPPVTLPAAPWRDGFILFNGEVRPGVRTPRVFQLLPAP